MAGTKFLQGYTGQEVDALIAMASEYRVDSIVLAFEQALQQRAGRLGLGKLDDAEITILAVEALEREVNNGGYHQFFLNTSTYAPFAIESLERIGCPKTAALTAQAVAILGVRAPFTAKDIDDVIARDSSDALMSQLVERCDRPYDATGEPIADRLFAYIEAHRGEIRLGMP